MQPLKLTLKGFRGIRDGLGRDEITEFMERENPAALVALRDMFRRLAEAGLWVTRRNSIAATLEAAP